MKTHKFFFLIVVLMVVFLMFFFGFVKPRFFAGMLGMNGKDTEAVAMWMQPLMANESKMMEKRQAGADMIKGDVMLHRDPVLRSMPMTGMHIELM